MEEKKDYLYLKNKPYYYNRNIKCLLDRNEMDEEIYNALTNKELITEENKLKIVKALVKENPKISKTILQGIDTEKYKLEIRILEKMITEQEKYEQLSDEQKEFYNKIKEMGSEYLKEGSYNEAYDCFSAGLYVTDHPIFLYYLGKTFYKAGMYRKAKYNLIDYRITGGQKATKAMLYLGRIYEMTNRNYKAQTIFDTANRIDETLGNSNHFKIYRK